MNDDFEEVNGIWYEYENDIAIVSVHSDDDIKNSFIKIPSEVRDSDGYVHKVTKIGASAFAECEKLEAIEISESITEIDTHAFSGCKNLKTVKLPSIITAINDSLFFGCENLQTLVIPEGVKSIGESAFWGCKKLKDLILPDSLERIDGSAFSLCESLTSLFIPAKVNDISSKALCFNKSLESIEVDVANTKYFSEGNCVLERDTRKLVAGCKTSVIPEYVKEIDDYAFYMNSGLTYVNLPQGIVKIGKETFSKCYGLNEVRIPSSVMQIGENAFADCNSTMKLICDFAKKPDGWADNLGLDKKQIVWTRKKGLLSILKNIFNKG